MPRLHEAGFVRGIVHGAVEAREYDREAKCNYGYGTVAGEGVRRQMEERAGHGLASLWGQIRGFERNLGGVGHGAITVALCGLLTGRAGSDISFADAEAFWRETIGPEGWDDINDTNYYEGFIHGLITDPAAANPNSD
jgi:hypothetical protein